MLEQEIDKKVHLRIEEIKVRSMPSSLRRASPSRSLAVLPIAGL